MAKKIVPPQFRIEKGPPPTKRQLLMSSCLRVLGLVILSSYLWFPFSETSKTLARISTPFFPILSIETFRAILLIAPAVLGLLTLIYGLSLRSNDRVIAPPGHQGPIIH